MREHIRPSKTASQLCVWFSGKTSLKKEDCFKSYLSDDVYQSLGTFQRSGSVLQSETSKNGLDNRHSLRKNYLKQ